MVEPVRVKALRADSRVQVQLWLEETASRRAPRAAAYQCEDETDDEHVAVGTDDERALCAAGGTWEGGPRLGAQPAAGVIDRVEHEHEPVAGEAMAALQVK